MKLNIACDVIITIYLFGYSNAEIDEGLKLAGVVPPADPAVSLSHRMAAGGQIGLATTDIATAIASPEIRAAVEATGVSWFIATFALITLIGIGWLVWQRVKQAKLEA